MHLQTLAQHQHLLARTHAAALYHDVVVLDLTVVGEPSHRGDVLFGRISLGGGVGLAALRLALADAVDLFVELSSVVVAELAGAGHSPGHSGGMPGSDTAHLAVTTMGFLLQMLNSEPLHDSTKPFTLGYSDDIDVLILGEHGGDIDLFLEQALAEVDLLLGVFTTVDLDLEDVVLLLGDALDQVHLSVADGTDHGAVLGHALELLGQGVVLLLDVFRERLLL